MHKNRFFFFLIIFTFFAFTAWSQTIELLKKDDIHKIMHQILTKHMGEKKLDTSIFDNALKRFIVQFDPRRIYLLEEEILPYIRMSEEDKRDLLNEYKNKDLSVFEKMNTLFGNSILRARALRNELIKTPDIFLNDKFQNVKGYAKSEEELKDRIQNDITQFLQFQMERYGAGNIKNTLEQALKEYEQQQVDWENPYLGVDPDGRPLPPAEKENLFVMHVLKALAGSLDAHTKVLNPQEAEEMRIRLEKKYFGIGLELRKIGNEIVVFDIIEKSPAAKEGSIKVDDRIIEINSHKVAGEQPEKIIEMMREAGSPQIELLLKHPNQDSPFKVTLKRELIPVNTGRVKSYFEKFGNGIIGIIGVESFYKRDNEISTENDIRKAIERLKKQGNLRGIVLDLRNNTGGFLAQAVKTVGLFISKGVVVISKYSNDEEHIYRDMDGNEMWDGPLIVLTSKETASAAEIVAQALQDYGVGLIVGDERTYGKGTIQSQTVTTSETGSPSFFKVTVGKYYTVSGKTPQKQGVKADIVVPSQFFDGQIGEEFLEHTLPSDTISPTYKDLLADIEPGLRPWYLKYYIPYIQTRVTFWQDRMEALRNNSKIRIKNNPAYQEWLNQPSWQPDNDMQMEEAVNIMKDMVQMES